MENTVYVKSYPLPPVDVNEAMRYAGVKAEPDDRLRSLFFECVDELDGKLNNKVCFREVNIRIENDTVDLGFMKVCSASLAENLSGCGSAVIFAATVGIGIDRLIAKYGTVSPTKALLFQALGAERIESLCDAFSRDVSMQKSANGTCTCRRFSPGYGDLPIEIQSDFFRVLDCGRKIGLTLNGSMMMSPSKSVTAIIGVKSKPSENAVGCGECENINCEYRRTK